VGGAEGVGMKAGEVEGVGGEVKGGRLFEEGVLLMLATWMRFGKTIDIKLTTNN